MRLSHRDFDRLQSAIHELHNLKRVDSFFQAVPALFLKVFPSQWFGLTDCEVVPRAKRVAVINMWESPRILDAEQIQRLEEAAFDHPFSRYTLETGDHTALKFSDFFSMAQFRASEIYNQCYRYMDAGRFLATATFSPHGLTTLNVSRAPGDPDFTERDRLLMNLLRPHFEIARHAAELNDARAASGAKSLEAYELSPREQEVAAWLARGKTSVEIASILSVRPRTIEKHMERILERTGTRNRTAAALLLANAPRKP
jgi:DNA-binding CsgD family transcriptional regulator